MLALIILATYSATLISLLVFNMTYNMNNNKKMILINLNIIIVKVYLEYNNGNTLK
jgi:hypothetical protein